MCGKKTCLLWRTIKLLRCPGPVFVKHRLQQMSPHHDLNSFFQWKQTFVNQKWSLPPITAHIPIIISVKNNWNIHFSTILYSSIFKQCFGFTGSELKLSLMLCRMDVSKLWAPGPFCLEVKVKGYGKRERTNFKALWGKNWPEGNGAGGQAPSVRGGTWKGCYKEMRWMASQHALGEVTVVRVSKQ